MTVNKAIEILNKEYNECVECRKAVGIDADDPNDLMIALLTAIDALKEKEVKG